MRGKEAVEGDGGGRGRGGDGGGGSSDGGRDCGRVGGELLTRLLMVGGEACGGFE